LSFAIDGLLLDHPAGWSDLDDHFAQHDAELPRIEGLPQEGESSAVEHEPFEIERGIAGDEDRRQLGPRTPDLGQGLHAVLVGEVEVEETHLDRDPPDDLDGLEAPRRRVDGVAVLDEQVLEALEKAKVVIQDEDAQPSAVAHGSKTVHGISTLWNRPGRRKGYAPLAWRQKCQTKKHFRSRPSPWGPAKLTTYEGREKGGLPE
jgi:hypothetical protein